jgi:hypothetical protein
MAKRMSKVSRGMCLSRQLSRPRLFGPTVQHWHGGRDQLRTAERRGMCVNLVLAAVIRRAVKACLAPPVCDLHPAATKTTCTVPMWPMYLVPQAIGMQLNASVSLGCTASATFGAFHPLPPTLAGIQCPPNNCATWGERTGRRTVARACTAPRTISRVPGQRY